MEEKRSDLEGTLVRLGGLWKQRSRNGKWYLSGKFGQAQVLVFPVSEKKSENSPDFVLMVGAAQKKDEEPSREARPFDDDDEAPRGDSRW